MLKDTIWNIFLKTGDIHTYLCYKKIDNPMNLMEKSESRSCQKSVISR